MFENNSWDRSLDLRSERVRLVQLFSDCQSFLVLLLLMSGTGVAIRKNNALKGLQSLGSKNV